MLTLNRKQYKDIKRYDHKQMDDFMTDIYAKGIQEGKKQSSGPTMDDVRNAISRTKGIGETKLSAIMENIGKLYQN